MEIGPSSGQALEGDDEFEVLGARQVTVRTQWQRRDTSQLGDRSSSVKEPGGDTDGSYDVLRHWT
jgi:hypothetical protein